MRASKYRVIFERDESGAWIARVPSVRGCHTHGRTLEQARRRLREALGLWVDDADTAELVEDIRLPARVLARGRTSPPPRPPGAPRARARVAAGRSRRARRPSPAARSAPQSRHAGPV